MSAQIHIGDLRARLTLEAPTRVGDGAGGDTITWRSVGAVWARVTPRSGSEIFELDRIAGRAGCEIVIRHRDDVLPEMRFRDGGRLFDIRAVSDPDGRRQWLRCLAEERDL